MATKSSLFSNKTNPVVKETRAENGINGHDAEILAATRLALACTAEFRVSSREEDGAKLDFFISFNNPWVDGEKVNLAIQVKSGETYGKALDKGFKLKTSAKKASRREQENTCILWVDRETSCLYWAFIHNSTTENDQKYGEHHEVCPATRYDLTRCKADKLSTPRGGKGITIKRIDFTLLRSQRRGLKTIYQGQNSIYCPLFGKVELTRLGWRHMLRHSRRKDYKKASLRTVPYLKHILAQLPSSNRVTEFSLSERNDYLYRRMEYVLSYDEVQVANESTGTLNRCKVIIRLLEEVRYPKNWKEEGMLSQRVERRVVLLNAYYKIE